MVDLAITLRPNERVVYQFSISSRLFWILIIFGIFLAIFVPVLGSGLLSFMGLEITGGMVVFLIGMGFIIGLFLIGYAFYFRAARHYVLTNQRLLETIGFVSRRTISADYEQVTDIRVSQDAFERLFLGTGLVAINTAGADVEEIRLERVANPYALSNQIRGLCEARLRELGKREAGSPLPSQPDTPPTNVNAAPINQ